MHELCECVGQWCIDADDFARVRMREVEANAVQGLAGERCERRACIQTVADQRTAEVLHVDANLMRATGVEHEFDERPSRPGVKHAIVRDGMLAGGEDATTLGVMAVFADGGIDGARGTREVAGDERNVGAADGLVA
jgi:hypothetical protein